MKLIRYVFLGLFFWGSIFFSAYAQNLDSLRFSDSKGHSHSLKDFEGKVVLLNLWATWCKPCLQEMPSLNRLQAKVREKNVEVITLNTNVSNPQVIEQFFSKYHLDALVAYYDPSGTALQQLNIRAIPVSFVINSRGKLVERIDGPEHWDSDEISDYLLSVP